MQTKLATCSYCGRRQALQLTARGGHELACGACGAPLHEMKWLKPPAPDQPKKRSAPRPAPHGVTQPAPRTAPDDGRARRPVKRRKPLWKKALEEVFEVIEEIFD
jgi:hypothetical protein